MWGICGLEESPGPGVWDNISEQNKDVNVNLKPKCKL